jgi:ABC-type hemin transport system substrate-binding protein
VKHLGRLPLARLVPVALVALAWGACEPEAHPTAPSGGPRVVSLSLSASRFALSLGAGDRLVGVDPASAALAPLAALPRVDLSGAAALEPDLVLVDALPERLPSEVRTLEERGVRVAEFTPHDIEEVLALIRDVGTRMVGAERALQFERALSRPLAAVAGESHGQPRPRVAALVSFDPLVIAGGHSFETDLIEIAGGHSVTHPGPEIRVPLAADGWKPLALDLILVVVESTPSPRAEQAMRNTLPPDIPVAFFRRDEDFWLDAPEEAARRLRAVIEPLSRRMQAEDGAGSEAR